MFYLHNYQNMPFKELKIHQDNSIYTLNLCIDISSDCQGSTVDFFNNNKELEVNYKHVLGNFVLHKGSKIHKGNIIEKGTRTSIICWIN